MLPLRNDLVHKPDLHRFIRSDTTSGHRELLGPAEPDETREALGPSEIRDDPPLRFHDTELDIGSGYPEVARDRQLDAGSERRARDGSDGRLQHLFVHGEGSLEPRDVY